MIKHYIKIAWRNLIKYRVQNLIALLALAIGFTGFSLCLYWIKYEMSYDTFHKDADRMFMVTHKTEYGDKKITTITSPLLASYLKEKYPEVEESCNTNVYRGVSILYENREYIYNSMRIDKRFMDFFNISLLSGNYNFLTPGRKEIAISEKLAKEIFGDREALGKTVEFIKEKYIIGAIFKEFSSHSNLDFETLIAEQENVNLSWNVSSHHTFLKIKKGIEVNQLIKKIEELSIDGNGIQLKDFKITPITAIRYEHPLYNVKVKFEHLLLFSISGSLLLFCAILNYMILFVSRLQIRNKEFALRKTCGASYGDLRKIFIFEFGILLFSSIFSGLLMSEIFLPSFKKLTAIQSNNNLIYLETFLFSLIISILSLLVSSFYIHYLNKRTVYTVFKSVQCTNKSFHNQKLFITIQLFIGTLFMFCTSVAIRQIHLLTHSDQIIERTERASLSYFSEKDMIINRIQSNPYITEILPVRYTALLPQSGTTHYRANLWDDKPTDKRPINLEQIRGDEAFCSYYGIQLIKGSFFKSENPGHVVINETAWREFGWDDPIGKTFYTGSDRKNIVTGIVRDFCKTVPTIPVQPILISADNLSSSNDILFKYQEGTWEKCKAHLEEQIREINPEMNFWLSNTEEIYNELLESENALVLLFDFVSVICIIISMFGVYSIVSLDCVNRQKEMAIRKINGAGVTSIASHFIKRYLLLLGLAVMASFPVGYYSMKSWLQSYILQTPITIWYYISILAVFAIMICLCISKSIVKIIKMNPVENLKTE